MEIRGTCTGCGKTYRVPSAEKSYTCKACGGSVRAQETGTKKTSAATPQRQGSRSTHRSTSGSTPGATPSRPTGERPTPRTRSRGARPKKINKGPWIALGLTVILGGAWALATQLVIHAATTGESDLSKVVPYFDAAWQDGDIDDLVSLVHPDKAREFDERLRNVVRQRGWDTGFPNMTKSGAGAAGQVPASKTSASQHVTEAGNVVCRWQFNESNSTWYIFDLKLPYPEMAPQLKAFEKDWERSSLEALAPYFAPGSAEKMGGVVTKLAKRHEWDKHPKLELVAPLLEPTASDSWISARTVDAVYRITAGELTVRWKHHVQSDTWRIAGLRVK